ncbi:MAG: tripartite tricarboxylate transporter substrate binding protein [Burkholderiales bacterium]
MSSDFHCPLLRRLQRKSYLHAVLIAIGLAVFGSSALAQLTYPTRAIRIVVPFPPGGASDAAARIIAEQLTRRLAQQVVVENQAGANGNIGTQHVAKSKPDGYTLLLGFDGTLVINPHVYSKLAFDPIGDFEPVGKIGDLNLVLVAHSSLDAKSLSDVVALSKARSEGLPYGSPGTGGTPHVAVEMFKQRTLANLTHIPYKGAGPATVDVMGGHIPLAIVGVGAVVQLTKTGAIVPLAVTSAQRSTSLPQVPTFMESGVADFEVNSWFSIMAPAGTPKDIVERLNTELNAVLAMPETRERLDALGVTVTPGTPEELRNEIRRDLARYGSVVKSAGIRIE